MRGTRGTLAEAETLRAKGIGWADLPGDALPFVLAIGKRTAPLLVVVDEEDAAHRVLRGLRFFLDDPELAAAFPADDVRPYDGFSPAPEVVAGRLEVLRRLAAGQPLVVVASARALMRVGPDAAARALGSRSIKAGDRLDRDALARELTATGYLLAVRAERPGMFAVRGDVVDVWSPGMTQPRRIDFFDDCVEAVRALDPATLKVARRSRAANILPAREERVDDAAIARFQEVTAARMEAQGRGRDVRRRLMDELRAGIRFSAIEDWLPALVTTATPYDLLGRPAVVVLDPANVAASARDVWETARRRYGELDDDERPLIPPEERFVSAGDLLASIVDGTRVHTLGGGEGTRSLGASPVEGFAIKGTDLGPVATKLRKMLDDNVRVTIVAPDARRATMVEELLETYHLRLTGRARPRDARPGELTLMVGDLPRGFIAEDSGWAFLPAHALFGGGDAEVKRRAHDLFESGLTAVTDLKADDYVVHRLHGIGQYLGLVRLEVNGVSQDFVRVYYRDADMLYVPATGLDQLSRYVPADSGSPVKLDKLGGATWAARKGKVRDALLAMAQDLLTLQAKRELASREPYDPIGPMGKAFAARFPYAETEDQAKAILDVHEDLSEDAPMDRLICGDVGFGKTEVAMRAAMRVVEGGRQVAILCPTTVLAFQHYLNFKARFEGFPIRVEMMSRFTPTGEEKGIREGLRTGTVDIVIATHSLLGRDVKFDRLGLIVVDEEHRFGVKQKARLQKMRADVDVLAMSATPIPRTMQMALSGLRKMSIMATPPDDRQEVRTGVSTFTRTRVRDAILLELERGGQAYFLHNRIESIESMREKLEEWVPEARFRVAHGQMDGEAIEAVLIDFVQKKFDVLICTAIVESGVDIPNVNTMLVHRADLFGLAQLYQLRGRVGRSSARGHCVLFMPEDATKDARRRVGVLVENTRLGSGFAIAAADLEIRGSGNLLGEAQSGHIDAVGYQVWVELLEEAVHAARGDVERDRIEPEVEVPVAALLPESMIPDMNERLAWYRRFSTISHPDDVEPLLDSLESEHGDLPKEVHALAGKVASIAICRKLGITRVAWLKVRVTFELHPHSRLTATAADKLIVASPKRFAVEQKGGARVLVGRFTPAEAERPYPWLRWAFARMEEALR